MGYPDWTAPMVWVLQEGELWPITEWVARQGQFKHWEVSASLASSEATFDLVYTVPEGKVLYISRVICSPTQDWYFWLYYQPPDVSAFRIYIHGYEPFPTDLKPPFSVGAGKVLTLEQLNMSESQGLSFTTIQGYEIPTG